MTTECGPTAILIIVLQLVFIVVAVKTYLVVKSANVPPPSKPEPVKTASAARHGQQTGRFDWKLLSSKKSKVWHSVETSNSRMLDLA